MKIGIIATAITLIFLSFLFAGKVIHTLGKNNDKNPIIAKTTIHAITRKIDIGTISADSLWNGKINIKNTGKSNLIIYGVQTSCGCVSATASPRPVPPDSIGYIQVKITPKGEGIFVQRIGVTCNVEKSPIMFSIKGKVKK